MPKRYELPDLRPRDLVRLQHEDGEALLYVQADGSGCWAHYCPTIKRLQRKGWDLRDSEREYTELGRLRDVDEAMVVDRWPEVRAALLRAPPLRVAPKIGDVLTQEQVAALPAGAITRGRDDAGVFVTQWNGKGEGRCLAIHTYAVKWNDFDPWGSRKPQPDERLLALGTSLTDRRAIYWALADQGFAPALEAVKGTARPESTPVAAVEVSATGTMVQVGDEVYIDEAPVGAVVTDDPAAGGSRTGVWCIVGSRSARPLSVVSPLRGQLPRAGTAPHRRGRVVALNAPVHRDRAALLQHLVDAGYEPARIGLAAQKVDGNAEPVGQEHGPYVPQFAGRVSVSCADKALDEPAGIEYREPMPEIKSTMKLDLKTETLSIEVPRLPGETDNAYAARAGALVKPHPSAAVPMTTDNVMMQAQPSWLERAAEALKPVAAELATEAKAQTRQAIALGGVEVARAAMHKGIAAVAQAVAPQHADKVVQVVDHPVTRWLENAGLFLGARAAGRPALAAVGLREVVRSPLEGVAGVLVQAASQVVGAVKGALVAADEAARVEQVVGQPEAAQVSAGEGTA